MLSFNTIIGQLEFAYGQTNSHIFLFYLRPEYRGKGYSQSIHAYVLNTLRQHNTQTATLRASPTNQRAIGFYKKQGWIDEGPDATHSFVNGYRLVL